MNSAIFSRWCRRTLFLGAAACGLAAAGRADTTVSTTVYSCRSQNQTYTVPAGADYIIVKAWGGGGGCGANTSGGDGNFAQATCNVSPGQNCTIKVGSGGACGSGGGWPNGYSGQRNGCGGGGGATEVDTPNFVLTACGGGGGGSSRSGYPGSCDGNNRNQCGGGDQSWDGGCGGGNGSYAFSGNCLNTRTQCGGNGTPPCANDSDYPGNNVACAGTRHNDGCPGAVVVVACKRVSPQAITFPNPGNQCANTTVALAAAASSGLPVSYVVTNGPATLTGASARLTATGSVTITASQAGSASFTAAAPVSVTFAVYTKPVVSPGASTGKLNLPLTYSITATGNPTSYGAAGLPPGLSVNASTGLISGTPAATGAFPVTISASSAGGSGSATWTLTVTQTYSLAITGSPSNGGSFTGGGTYDPGAVVAISEAASSGYRAGGWGGTDGSKTAAPSQASTTITMNGNRTLVANFVRQATLTVTAGTGGTTSGSGTYDVGAVVPISAVATGNYAFMGWSGSGVTNSHTASTTVVVPANEIVTASFMQPPTFTAGTANQILVVGRSCSVPVSASGATSFGAASLPTGLSVNCTSGLISGSPTTAGPWTATITATNAAGSASEPIVFTVYPTPVITSTSVSGKQNEPFSTTITASGNPTSFGATGLPPGLSINPVSGVISGTPTSTGSFPVTVTATNPGTSGSGTVTVHVTQTYTLTISGSPDVGGTYSGSGTYDPGTVVTVSETANTGYRASGWGGTDGSHTAAPSNATTTIVMSANRSLAAKFVAQATLTVTAGTGGSATGGGVYDVGATVPIVATPADGYTFTAWNGTGVTQTGAASSTVTVAGNEIVMANFAQPPPPPVVPTYTLTISGSPAAGGTFSGSGNYPAGTVVTIMETPAAGYRANGWGGPDAGNTAAPANTTTTIVLNADANLTANFIQQGTLTVSAGAGGLAVGGGTYDFGTVVPISATPNSNYVFNSWTGGAADPSAVSSTVTITGNMAMVASFTHVPQPPTTTLNAAPTAYTGSPFTVTSAADAPDDNLTLHTIEWLSPAGAWTVDSASASGSSDNRSLGINFATAGVWTLRAGVSVDNGVTWVYSPSTQVTVADGITSYTLASMAVPNGNALAWYASSPVVQRTYQVKHLNP